MKTRTSRRRAAAIAGGLVVVLALAAIAADTKISALGPIGVLHGDDLLMDVDVHDTSMGATGTNKRLTVAQLLGAGSGDVTYAGLVATAARVNGVAYPAAPPVGTVPVVTGTNQVTYQPVPVSAGGTGQATAAGAIAALSPQSARGDLLGYAAAPARVPIGTDGYVLTADSTQAAGVKWAQVTGTGTVTTLSVASANGLGGTVANASTTPAITLTTSVAGLLKGNGTAVSAAVAGTDYVTPSGSISGAAGNVTGTVAVVNGGTGQTTASGAFAAISPLTTKGDTLAYGAGNTRLAAGADGQVLTADSAQSLGLKWATPVTGSVSSVGMTVPSWLAVSGSPVTAAGTLAVTAAPGQAANSFLAAPDGSVGSATMRAIVPADLPATGLTITQHAGTIAVPSGTSGTITLDLSTSDWFAPAALTGTTTLALSNPTVGQQFTVVVIGGGNAVTWFAGALWPGGTAPTLTTTAGKRDVFTFKCISAGVYLAFAAGQNL